MIFFDNFYQLTEIVFQNMNTVYAQIPAQECTLWENYE